MVEVLRWHTGSDLLSPECKKLLRSFSMKQRELSLALLEAKQLGICKTSIFGTNVSNWRNPVLTCVNGKNNTILDTFGKNDLKEIF